MQRTIKCIGDTCQIISQSGAEIAGAGLGLVSSASTLTPAGLATAATGAPELVAQRRLFEQDAKLVKGYIKQVRSFIARLQRLKYPVCALPILKETVAVVEARIEKYLQESQTTRAFRAAWPTYYRDELQRDQLLIVGAMVAAIQDATEVQLELNRIQTMTSQADRANALQKLKRAVCPA